MTDPLATPLTELLGCRLPVIQTAMGWIAEPALVAATVEAGGFGFLGAAVMTPAEAGAKIAEVRRLTSRPFGVNFHMFQPGAAELVDIVIANRDQVRAVSFGRGPDAKMIGRFRDAGIVCVPTVGAVKHARKMASLGVDMLVVQGGEGGGHTGSVASTVLLPQVLDAVDLPVMAAGGFADGRGLAAALAYGAAGIAMGTRFLMTRESPVPAPVKQLYVAAGTDDIVVTDAIDGLPQRMIRNAALRRLMSGGPLASWANAVSAGLMMKRTTGASWGALLRGAQGMRSHGGLSLSQAMRAAAAPALIQRAVVSGDGRDGLMATGQVAGRLDDLPSVAELLDAIERDARDRIAALVPPPSIKRIRA
ncbi:NAD(P)H-dependent flavin oxidoreductase [Sphingomonas colocasiae]|uniref:Nitronate monooxygenase n=1 Tax=Sphingomonas colocasiae TaxID=1848973 RepID=A0ABS7PRD8_9SPHN|nr:nitronate monooxygenase [Sphingomonas colocasiae]MBY8823549.1 nitronate monooxygenase [Sphingomonas colocasiae]